MNIFPIERAYTVRQAMDLLEDCGVYTFVD